ncbi:hypothetical protein EVAR_53133_1 [Eumeta japonica]|uniref:Uncharacterized protein n=1 Tax=Eumeta variegata TaxID=151549 RepID=A0A4C1YBH4_EUMVA|nr:hypothetical protein EVAR_53133_1 [Eumeta japonica]
MHILMPAYTSRSKQSRASKRPLMLRRLNINTDVVISDHRGARTHERAPTPTWARGSAPPRRPHRPLVRRTRRLDDSAVVAYDF